MTCAAVVLTAKWNKWMEWLIACVAKLVAAGGRYRYLLQLIWRRFAWSLANRDCELLPVRHPKVDGSRLSRSLPIRGGDIGGVENG